MGKKIIISVIVIISLLAIVIGITYKKYINKERVFYATVTDVGNNYVLVKPFPEEKIRQKTNNIIINTNEEYKEDDTILVHYKGEVTETNPSTINVIEIELVSTKIAKGKNDEDINENNQNIDNNDGSNNSNNNDNNNDKSTSNQNNNKEEYTEDDVISYFNDKSSEISNYQNTSNYKEKAKEIFVTAVDFLFYDGEIKGHKFKDLSNTAKLKVLNIVFNIDDKIDNKFPGYKQELSEKYQDAKNMIAVKYLELTANICANHDDYCDKAKDIWDTIKEKTSISWSTIKKYANTGIKNLKEWYEIYRSKN